MGMLVVINIRLVCKAYEKSDTSNSKCSCSHKNLVCNYCHKKAHIKSESFKLKIK